MALLSILLPVCEFSECLHREGPICIQPVAYGGDTAWVEVVDAACAFGGLSHEAGLFQHFEMLRYGRSAYGQAACQLAYRFFAKRSKIMRRVGSASAPNPSEAVLRNS